MPKTKISEFSSTPANNTDIDSINIAEGCAPSGINDAIRELMAQLKDFQTGAVGDSFNGPVGSTTASTGAFTTLSASGAVTLSGGTANGVTYLNGSKVVTSGSALTFDGTVLTNKNNINAFSGTNSADISFGVGNSSTSTNAGFFGWRYNSGSPYVYVEPYAQSIPLQIGGSDVRFQVAVSEQMRLTSTGLGIGTSSPSEKLEVVGNYIKVTGTTNQVALRATNTGGDAYFGIDNSAGSNFNTGTAYAGVVWRSGANPICFVNNSTERMRLDSSGNLGLGVTPSAWAWPNGSAGALQLQSGAAMSAYNATTYLSQNWYYNAGEKYIANGFATRYEQTTGKHAWYTAASGTAGNAVSWTQAMTLDASGNLLVGTTSGSFTAGSRGNITVGGSSSAIYALQTGGTAKGYIFHDGTEMTIANEANGFLRFYTNATERARIDSSGRFLVGTTSSTIGSVTCAMALDATTVNSGFGFGINGNASNTQVMRFAYAGTAVGSITVGASSTAYNTSSDQRLKENIQDADSASSLIDALQVRKFDWKADGSHQRYGFVAQELVTVAPEAVHQPADTEEMMAVDYSKLVPMLVKEVQSLRKRLADAGL